MARQFTAPVPPAWGWFGAVLLGLAIFGGIKLATARQRIGIALAAVGGLVAVAVDTQYFAAAGHDGVVHHAARFGDIGREGVRLASVEQALHMLAAQIAAA